MISRGQLERDELGLEERMRTVDERRRASGNSHSNPTDSCTHAHSLSNFNSHPNSTSSDSITYNIFLRCIKIVCVIASCCVTLPFILTVLAMAPEEDIDEYWGAASGNSSSSATASKGRRDGGEIFTTATRGSDNAIDRAISGTQHQNLDPTAVTTASSGSGSGADSRAGLRRERGRSNGKIQRPSRKNPRRFSALHVAWEQVQREEEEAAQTKREQVAV